jgi:hypothetical protein
MMSKCLVLTLSISATLLICGGCATDNSASRTNSPSADRTSNTSKVSFVRLSEKDIDVQEANAEEARRKFYCGQYPQSIELIQPLCRQRTTSQPLYLCEIGSGYIASNDKVNAKKNLTEAYSLIEGFFDPASEKRAMSLWGAEAQKVYKGDPYEQATLSLFVGLLLFEEGDFDNALSCFKNGQMADSDVKNERFQSDYGLLQLLQAKCHQMRNEQEQYEQFAKKAKDSFAKTHPYVYLQQVQTASKINEKDPNAAAKEEALRLRLAKAESKILEDYDSYFSPLFQQYNTLLLVWTGRAPEMGRSGQYGEKRVCIKKPSVETHFEVQVDGSEWHDVIRGFANVSFQATTRGGRAMDNVLADRAAFKSSAYDISKTMLDAANNTSDPYAKLALLGMGLIAHGVGSAANTRADIRCWKTLPDEIAVVPLQLLPGTHQIRVDCYGGSFLLRRSLNYQINVEGRPFQFYSIVVPDQNSSAVQGIASAL